MKLVSGRYRSFKRFYKDSVLDNKRNFVFMIAVGLIGIIIGIVSAVIKHEVLIEKEFYLNYVALISSFECGILTFFIKNIFIFIILYAFLYITLLSKKLKFLIYISYLYYCYNAFRGAVVLLIYCGVFGILSAIFYYVLLCVLFSVFYLLATMIVFENNYTCCINKQKAAAFDILVLFIVSLVLILIVSIVLYYVFSIVA